MKTNTLLVVAVLGSSVATGVCCAVAGEMTCADYEAYVRAVESIPPVVKTAGLENYSSNRLTFALMNALEMTRGGRIWLNWISGGDSAESFTAGCWSDDGGGYRQPHTAIDGSSWCNDWDWPDAAKKDYSRYFEAKVKPQVKEIRTQYGDLCLVWFDTPQTISAAQSRELAEMVRTYNPGLAGSDPIDEFLLITLLR